jgi:hypothetical protein
MMNSSSGLSPIGDLDSSSGGSDNTNTTIPGFYANQGIYGNNVGGRYI